MRGPEITCESAAMDAFVTLRDAEARVRGGEPYDA